MKTYLLSLSALVLLGSTAFCQDAKYTDPEPRGSEPVAVPLDQAISEAASVAGECGYSKAYFTNADLTYLMDLNSCVGIRIYNGKEDPSARHCSVIAVAVDSDGKEIGHFASNKYMQVQSYDADQSCTSKKVSKSYAKGCVQTVADDQALNYQKVFFSKSFIEQRMNKNEGVAVMPGTDGKNSTMMVSGAKLSNGKITEMEGDYYRSLLPCPTDCGETDNYLVSPN